MCSKYTLCYCWLTFLLLESKIKNSTETNTVHYPDKAKNPTGIRETSKRNNNMETICWMQAGCTGNSVRGMGGGVCAWTDVTKMKRSHIRAFILLFPVFRTHQIKVLVSFPNSFFCLSVSAPIFSCLLFQTHLQWPYCMMCTLYCNTAVVSCPNVTV